MPPRLVGSGRALPARNTSARATGRGSLAVRGRGETGEALPAAEQASRFRGSGAIGGPVRGRGSHCRNGGP